MTILSGSKMASSAVIFDMWAAPRPKTKHWGSGILLQKITDTLGKPDVSFGKQDQVDGFTVDIDPAVSPTVVADWRQLPFKDNQFEFGYWDPPYDKLYKPEGQEIWRCVRRIAILHTHIWPRAWLAGANREAMIAITLGPMKQIRCLQVFKK